jgi:hypothetical protein
VAALNGFAVLHVAILIFVVIHLGFRIWQLRGLKDRDDRIFLVFWFWPLAYFGHCNFVPFWKTNLHLADAASLALIIGGVIDFIVYFIFSSKDHSKRQWASLIIPALPWVLVYLYYFQRDDGGAKCVLPIAGEQRVWTDHWEFPNTFYFMRNERGYVWHPDPNRDPNYGRAIFSPLTGKVNEVSDQWVKIEGGEGTFIEIGPFMSGTQRVKVGDEVFADQPLGLSGRVEGMPPGICVRVDGDVKIHFGDFYGGRWLGGRFESQLPFRNWSVRSDSRTRFQLGQEDKRED